MFKAGGDQHSPGRKVQNLLVLAADMYFSLKVAKAAGYLFQLRGGEQGDVGQAPDFS